MAEIAAAFLGPAIEVVKCVAAPIKRQIDYLCCFNSNIQSLRVEAEKLDDAQKGLQIQVDRAKDNVQVIVPEVKTWLKNSNEFKGSVERILDEVPKVESGYLKLGARYSLSRRAKKMADLVKELRGQCNFSVVSQQGPPPATEAVPLGTTYEFESRKQIEEDIMTSLKKKDVRMIGICGMGGVGKTTMAKRVMNRALEEHLFDEVVMVVISQKVDELKIQLEIGGSLGLNLAGEATQARVQKLHARLSGTKRILIVLDDIWKSLVLEDLGIPCGEGIRGRCTLLLTSRNRDVLREMMVEKVCGLQILSEGEAWFLFREKTGTCVDEIGLKPTAKQVMRECNGLPIALATVGTALRDENDISIWEDALRQLKKSNPSDIPNILTEVYNPLKLSYDFLDSEHARTLFLLCCLFREDDNIPLDHLTYFSMGLRMFEGIWELEEARGRIRSLVKMLTNRFLLLDGSDEDHFKMHDVVRDVSIFIASKQRLINCNDCTWISSFVNASPRLCSESGLPNLHLLLLDGRVDPEFQINDSFIEGTRELNVMFIRHGLLRSLPNSAQLLKHLVTLVLHECESLETISVVGQLASLEVLICHSCVGIKEVPVDVMGLKRLRLLEVSSCRNLKNVAPGVISSLVGLEELKISSFNEWEGEEIEGKERKNAGLRELELLTNLRCLRIQVLDSTLAAAPMHYLSPKLVKFFIQFGENCIRDFPPKKYQKILFLNFSYKKNVVSGDLSANMFLRCTEYLFATGYGTNINWDLANARNIRWLTLTSFRNMKSITTSTAGFPLLEFLSLEYLDSLEEIWDGSISSNSFKNLKELRLVSLPALKQLGKSPYLNNFMPLFTNLSSIVITRCPKLRHLFSSATTKDCLSQLETIKIENCDALEHLVLRSEGDSETDGSKHGRSMTIFPKLKSIHLHHLPSLTSLCKGVESMEFPALSEMDIHHCIYMKYLVSWGESSSKRGIGHDHYQNNDSLHVFCQPKVSFGNFKKLRMSPVHRENAWCDQVPVGFFSGLEQLEICNYFNIRSFFSSSVAENLINLQTLRIDYCFEMVNVVKGNEEGAHGTSTTQRRVFPRLHEIVLEGLYKLESFCEWRCTLELPSLRELSIHGCSKMRSFSAGPVITPALQTLRFGYKNLAPVEDLNATIQQYSSKPMESPWKDGVQVRKCW